MLTGDGDPLAALFESRSYTAVRWGLDRIEALLEELGRPERSFETLHLAGTNGKGSTASFAASMLRAGGLRTGLYTSPHLSDIRERFLVDGAWMEAQLLEIAAARVGSCATAAACTYFEVATALAFTAFAECGVQVAVVETGLGGRHDATNVLRPAGTAITSIDLDHTALLGATAAAIAAEKAGIFKPGVPASLGKIDAGALGVLEREARRAGAPVARLGRDAELSDIRVGPAGEGTHFRYASSARPSAVPLATALPGRHQAHNAALALLMLDRSGYRLPERAVRRGIEGTRLAGRLELRELGAGRPRCVLDIAHNPAAMEVLCDHLAEIGAARPLVAVVGMLADKDWEGTLARLALDSDAMILTRSVLPGGRRWDPELAGARLRAAGNRSRITVCANVAAAVSRGLALAGLGTLLITGSAYTVGEARALPELARAEAEE